MRAEMIAGLRAWRDADAPNGQIAERVAHDGWVVEKVNAPQDASSSAAQGNRKDDDADASDEKTRQARQPTYGPCLRGRFGRDDRGWVHSP
ncbi:MAG: hypothetical protein P4L76_13915 [Beijerinckiaceae bacterium]|nr:hypothetical protein [Beijerinckiaceae bacterium]